jgi:tetratricopeptide (TPR) repeat protein
MSEPITPENVAAPAPVPRGRALSRRKKWAFRAAALLLVPSVLACAEVGLRLGGFGRSPELVMPVEDAPPAMNYVLNPAVEFPYYPVDLSGPEPRRFEMPKPAGVYRIVFLGGSTVIGFPYGPELAFPRQVEVLLEAQSPALEVEALNAGVTGMNSFTVADLADQALDCDPDLLVIYTGHNEFFGPGGPASSALPLPPALFEPIIGVRRTRLAQLVSRFTAPDRSEQQDLMQVLPRLTEVPLESDVVAQAGANYRRNLERAVQCAGDRGVPVVLSTVACNLRDQGPVRSVWPAGLSTEDRSRCERIIREANGRLGEADWDGALSLLRDAERIGESFAEVQFRKAQAFEQSGRYPEARDAYRLARDLDGCRFRAPESFRDICRDVAGQFGEGVYFLDMAAEVEEASAPHAPGHNLFLEHVRYNLAGHRLLAERIARLIHTDVRGGIWRASRAPTSEEFDRLLGVLPEDGIAAYSFGVQVVQTPPLDGGLTAAGQEQFLLQRIEERYLALPAVRRESFADLSMSEMSGNLTVALSRAHAARGELETALELAETGVARRPWSRESRLALAQLQVRTGNVPAATETLRRALEIAPGWPPAVELLDRLAE